VKTAVIGVALSFVVGGGVLAQQPIEWKQTINLAKGLNLPKDLKLDILGIEPGSTYAEAKAVLERLLAESRPARPPAPAAKQAPPPAAKGPAIPGVLPVTPLGQSDAQRLGTVRNLDQQSQDELSGVDRSPPLVETNTVIRLPVPGGGSITANFIGELRLKRELPGAGPQKILDNMTVSLSAPSSGHQVLAVARSLHYSNQPDQPRVSELVAQLKSKYGPSPQVEDKAGSAVVYLFQFDDGQPVTRPNSVIQRCYPIGSGMRAQDLPDINKTGNCDVILSVEIRYGISKDHASAIIFTLSDNERAKANWGADFAYFDAYVREYQARTRGAAPKL
jgi:hypothetical protein